MRCDACLEDKELLPSDCIHGVCAECEVVLRDEGNPCPINAECHGKPIIFANESYESAIERQRCKLLEIKPAELEKVDDGDVETVATELLEQEMGVNDLPDDATFICRKGDVVYSLLVEQLAMDQYRVSYQKAGLTLHSFTLNSDKPRVKRHKKYATVSVGRQAIRVGPRGCKPRIRYEDDDITDLSTGITIRDGNTLIAVTNKAREVRKRLEATARSDLEQQLLEAYESELKAEGAKRKLIEANIEVLEMHAEYEAKGLAHLLRPLTRRSRALRTAKGKALQRDRKYVLSSTASVLLCGNRLFLDAGVVRAFSVGDAPQWTANGDTFSVLSSDGWTALSMSTGEPRTPQPVQLLYGCEIPLAGRVSREGKGLYVGSTHFW